jgi:hypothetical protein
MWEHVRQLLERVLGWEKNTKNQMTMKEKKMSEVDSDNVSCYFI